jgi:hypothetical protein
MNGSFDFDVPALRMLNRGQMLLLIRTVLEMHACLHHLALLWNSGVGSGSCTWEGHATGLLKTDQPETDQSETDRYCASRVCIT